MTFSVPPTRKEAALRQLRSEIVSGALAPGTLVKDAEIAARLGISITPVREAIAQLAAEGLVDVAPNRTRRVSVVSRRSALELIDIMGLLACAGLEWGIEAITPPVIEEARAHLEEFERCIERGDAPGSAAAGTAFSRALISAAGNRELQTHLELVVTRTLRLMSLSPDTAGWSLWRDGYSETLERLSNGDNAGAVERYRRIYKDYRARLETLPLFGEE